METPTKKTYKITLAKLEEIYKGTLEGVRATEGAFPAPVGYNQSAGGAAMSIAGCGSDPLHSSGEFNLLKLFVTYDEAKLTEIENLLKREYPTRPLAWVKVLEWVEARLNPPVKIEVKPKTAEEAYPFTWPCGARSIHSIGTAAIMSQGMNMDAVVCVGYHSKDKPRGCGKRFVWSDKEQKWIEDTKPLPRVTRNPSSIFSDLQNRQ